MDTSAHVQQAFNSSLMGKAVIMVRTILCCICCIKNWSRYNAWGSNCNIFSSGWGEARLPYEKIGDDRNLAYGCKSRMHLIKKCCHVLFLKVVSF